MLLKNKDDNQEGIDYLSDLLERDIPDDKKRLIERELKNIDSGNKGEKLRRIIWILILERLRTG